jgi:DNA-binding response OmpR family regulator
MRILIAEDVSTSRRMLAAMLRTAGHEPMETVDGFRAWEELQKSDAPRLVVLDWMMPEMDGLEILRRVRALPTDRPPYILMLTSRTEKAEIIAALDAGANDYLSKPYDAGELRARIEVGSRALELQDALANKIEELRRALAEIKTLRCIAPICSICKDIRDDSAYWRLVEAYVREHPETEFSRGICPECMKKLYPELAGNAEDTP